MLKILNKVKKIIGTIVFGLHPISILNAFMDIKYSLKFNAIPNVDKIIWVDPFEIKLILNNEQNKRKYFGRIMDGDWDLDTRCIIGPKYKSLVMYYVEGREWEETPLFDRYKERLIKEKKVLGCKNIEEIKAYYRLNIDTLYFKMKEEGFLPPSKENANINPIYIYIGRDGEIIYSDNGNHRLSFAKILGLNKIPVKVRARHKRWQIIREEFSKKRNTNLSAHPDMQDLIK